MAETCDVERAERLGRRRARMFTAQGILFLVWQGFFYIGDTGRAMRTVDVVRISAWLVWALALLLLLATGGGLVTLLKSRSVRALLNDEYTRRNRSRAYVYGFWAAAGSAVGLYVVDMFELVTGREAIHIILSAAIGTALLNFALAERRALRED